MVWPTDRDWPSIALEVGYSEDYADLLADANHLLEGSDGRIGLVIIVKLNPLKPGEDEITYVAQRSGNPSW